MDLQTLSTSLHGIWSGAISTINWLTGACATCACASGHCAGPGAMGAGSAGSGAAAGGGIGPRKVLPLPGGGWLGTDGRVHYGVSGGVGPVSGDFSADAGAAPGSDPRGPIVDVNWKVSGKVGPIPVGSHSGNVSAGISEPVQTNYSSHYGSKGTHGGAWMNQFVNSNE